MPDMVIDFSDVQADAFTLVPPGTYQCIVKEVTMKKKDPTEETPKPAPYLNFRLAIAEGDHQNRNLFFIASFSEKSVGRTKALLQSFGVDVSGKVKMSVDPETGHLNTPDLVGEPCTARVRFQKGEGGFDDQAKVSRLTGAKGEPETATSENGATQYK